MYVAEKKKLTLRVDSQLIEEAKEYASLNNTSVSQLVEVYLRDLSRRKEIAHTPLVQRLTGIIPPDSDIDDARFQYLLDKYGE
ncbi:MAG: hypothetical protein HND44_01310 [Chloroflexi bacterium]|nr:hypothetical protein [Ardenticatenaceae bacterium]MBL1127138.1 hypothetical protein [Chloroflexota bacterium]NOG33197.1 hypothetical protein [Chloroflexota bacterium]GIK54993.1 MAG: hypothetical protein BroJett015_06560 [Chloroflexota bacterium]